MIYLIAATILSASPARAGCWTAAYLRVKESATCPPIFGTAAERVSNTSRRVSQALTVSSGFDDVDITYSEGTLTSPQPISLASIQLLRTMSYEDCEPMAVVSVAPDLARRSGCAPGAYLVRTDDKIGIKNAIAGIFGGGLLLIRDESLRALVPKEAEPPRFRMIWQSKWRIPEATSPTLSSSTPPTRPNNYGNRR